MEGMPGERIKKVEHLPMPENILLEASFHLKILSNTYYC